MTSATAAVATTPATAWKREGRGEERERRRHAIGRKPRGRARVRRRERLRKENVSRLSSTLARPDRGRVRPGSGPRALARDANTAAGGGVGSRYRVELELRVDRDSRASAPARGTAQRVRSAMRYGAWENKPRPASWKTESHAAPVSTAWERSRADPTPRPTATASMKTRARRADAAGAIAGASADGNPERGPAVRQVDIRVAGLFGERGTHLLLHADGVDGGGGLGDHRGAAASGLAGASRDAGGERNLAGLSEDGHGFRCVR